jgi:cell wall-associated NlpC family hydrolase
MKIKKLFIQLAITSLCLNPILAYADNPPAESDPILNIMTNYNGQETNNKPNTTNTNTVKPIASKPSENPDDDDDDFPTDDKPKNSNYGALANGNDAVTNMLLQSVSLLGISYKWGGNTPTSGMDCSGFVRYVYQKSMGITLPRTAAEQAKIGKKVSIDDLQPGDLMFFNSRRGSNTHVGMYIGNNKFIQSPRTGDVIKISEFTDSWRKRFNGAKRIVNEKNTDDGDTSLDNYQSIRSEPLPVSHRAVSSKRSSRRGAHNSTSQSKRKTKATAKKSSAKSTTTTSTKASSKAKSSSKTKKNKSN